MALNTVHVLEHMKDTLGGGDIPAELDKIGILNQAGEHLHSMWPWRWAQGRSTLLSLRGTVEGTTATWTAATKTLTQASAFTDYTFVEGDEIEILDGTGATTGFYTIASRTSANAIVLSTSLSSVDLLVAQDIAWTLQPQSIDLPDDCRDIIAIQSTGDTTRSITLTSLQDVLDAREHGIVAIGALYGAVSYVGTPPTPILEIAPASSASVQGAFRMFYRARWARISNDNTALPVPEFCEALFLQIARAFARGYVREDVSSLDERLAQITMGPVFMHAKRSDAALQPYMGTIRGGGATIWRRGRGKPMLDTFVNPPS